MVIFLLLLDFPKLVGLLHRLALSFRLFASLVNYSVVEEVL